MTTPNQQDFSARLLELVDQLVGQSGGATPDELLRAVLQRRGAGNPAPPARELFRAMRGRAAAREWLEGALQVVAQPREPFSEAIAPGDIIVRRALGEGGPTYVAVVAGPELRHEELAAAGLTPEDDTPGSYVQVVEGGHHPHGMNDRFARRVRDSSMRSMADQLVVRLTPFLRPPTPLRDVEDDTEEEGLQRTANIEELDWEEQEPPSIQTGRAYKIINSDARIRSGPPDFRFVAPTRTLPRHALIRVQELQGTFANVQGADGTQLSWTAAANLGRYYKDDATLIVAPRAPVPQVAIESSWDSKTRAIANTYNRLGGLMGALAQITRAPIAGCLAVWYVESGGRAHVPGHATIRFENHRFFRSWGQQHEEIYNQHFRHGGPEGAHENHMFRERPEDEFITMHVGSNEASQGIEYRALALAARLSTEEIALQCISMGGPQIMVDNFSMIGYSSPKEMYDRFQEDERWHVLGFFDYCQFRTKKQGELIAYLQQGDFRSFASIYNGTKQVDKYSKWISEAHAVASKLNLPSTSKAKTTVAAGSGATLPNLSEWKDLISFRPPVAVQKGLQGGRWSPDWSVQRIEDAHGDINLDYYPVTVSRLPSIGGLPATAEQLLEYIRLNFNSFIDTNVSLFTPYNKSFEIMWKSSNPVGTVISIDMRMLKGWANADDGSVVVAEAATDHWILSTIWTPSDLYHPVSGNRRWGFEKTQSGQYTYYTRGADRATGKIDNALSATIFSAADTLWRSLQNGIATFVNANGGVATVDTPTSARYDWPAVKTAYFNPTVPWI